MTSILIQVLSAIFPRITLKYIDSPPIHKLFRSEITKPRRLQMLFWSAILFGLGIAAFLDALFNYGEIFRKINSVLFLLISLAILVRTTTKMKDAKIERYKQQVEDLEQKVNNLSHKKEKSLY